MITSTSFAKLKDGTEATLYKIPGENGAYVTITDYGATVQSIVVPDIDGNLTDVILGYDDVSGYESGTLFFGATVGRHANRIGAGKFILNGVDYQLECNDGPNHLHGGSNGYHQRMFTPEICGDTLKMSLVSPDGDQGYPGELKLTVEFSFAGNQLKIHYLAETDKDTVINLTNHSYFDLSGGVNPKGQLLWINADEYTENDCNTLPTGVISPAAGTPFDFTAEKAVQQDSGMDNQQLKFCCGYDHNFVIHDYGTFRKAAQLRSTETGIRMEVMSDLPGMQFYGGNFIDAPIAKGGKPKGKNDAVCLETQHFPNAMAVEGFEKPVLKVGETYDHVTEYRFFCD